MLLEGKSAVVWGAGGMGGAMARAFSRHGAVVHIASRTGSKLDAVAKDIEADGGRVSVTELDVFDVDAVEALVAGLDRVDISFNAVGLNVVQNKPLVTLTVEEFVTPVAQAARSQFVTATAVARRMIDQRHGVIMMLSSSAAR